tara:strand:- start:195 stop:524 length:330 start_codon:yes stop_codon:yes gene_type:complete
MGTPQLGQNFESEDNLLPQLVQKAAIGFGAAVGISCVTSGDNTSGITTAVATSLEISGEDMLVSSGLSSDSQSSENVSGEYLDWLRVRFVSLDHNIASTMMPIPVNNKA